MSHTHRMPRVFVLEVEDIDATDWTAEIAVAADTKDEVYRKIQDAGLHKKQIHNRGLPVRTESLADWDVLSQNPTAMLRRRTDYAEWTERETGRMGCRSTDGSAARHSAHVLSVVSRAITRGGQRSMTVSRRRVVSSSASPIRASVEIPSKLVMRVRFPSPAPPPEGPS